MPIGSTPLTAENRWEEVTVQNKVDRNGPVLKRIGVPGGWLYMAGEGQTTFVVADRSDAC